MPNSNFDPVKGRVFIVYRNHDRRAFITDGIVCAIFNNRTSADRYVEIREENDQRIGEENIYNVVTWLVQS
jgi:hypothetical protein